MILMMACLPAPPKEPVQSTAAATESTETSGTSGTSGSTGVEPVPAGPPTPYGFWGLNGFVNPAGLETVKKRIGLTIFQVATSDPRYAVGTLLPMVRNAHLLVTLRLPADHDAYTSAQGDFDLTAWKVQVSRWENSGIQAFIDDGTLVGHMLLDDIANFPGRDPDAADLEEMARYSKELMPGLMTFVRQKASAMPVPVDGKYHWVDAQVNQYEVREGAVDLYAANEEAHAMQLGLGMINGLNIADGGDGSSGQAGYRARHFAMSATEIGRYGAVLAKVPSCGMFLNWEYDNEEKWNDGTIGAEYFARPDLQSALLDLGLLVARHPPVTLLKPAAD